MRALLAAAFLFSGCSWVAFNRRVGVEEYAIEEEVKEYYQKLQGVFAAENPDALAQLFDQSIARPMTWTQIRDWGRKFFAENQGVGFHVDKIAFQGIGPGRADVLLTYHVTTAGGKGDFGGTELDTLVKRDGRWRVLAWEKQAAPR